MRTLSSKKKNFNKVPEGFLQLRKDKLKSNNVIVTKIIKDVKKNGEQKVTTPKSSSSPLKKKIN